MVRFASILLAICGGLLMLPIESRARVTENLSPATHPFHSTLAEMEWNSETGKFEVALSLWPVDVEEVLRRDEELLEKVGGLIELDDEDQHELLDEALKAYVQSKLALFIPQSVSEASADDSTTRDSPRNEQEAKLSWLGFEVERDSVWCYFELVPVGPMPSVETNEPEADQDDSEADASDEQEADANMILTLRSTLFHELHPDQENSALVKVVGRRFAVRCTVENPRAQFDWPAR